jgi:hypothetical protein
MQLFQRAFVSFLAISAVGSVAFAQAPVVEPGQIEYLLLATSRTSTLQNELNEAADAGYRFMAVMGGETAFGGSEVVSVMERTSDAMPRFQYQLLATGRTSTMQNEMQAAGDAGFEYRGQTVFNSSFGGDETIVILERDELAEQLVAFEYRLLATSKTETMQDELREAGQAGFEFVGLTVASTRFGGSEIVSILRRPVPPQ